MLNNIKITIFARKIKSETIREVRCYGMSNLNLKKMLKEKAGETAGKIWNALNETEGLTAKQIKKATKLKQLCMFGFENIDISSILRDMSEFNKVDIYPKIFRKTSTQL